MTIYVDEPIWPYRNALYCHCMIDRNQPIEALHAFAQSIGMQRRWFQNKTPALAHYDLSPRMRAAAVKAGAIEVDAPTMIMKCRRGKRPMSPKPKLIDETFHLARLKPDYATIEGNYQGMRVNTPHYYNHIPDAVEHTSYELDAIADRDEYLFNRFFKVKVTTELIALEADDFPWNEIFKLYSIEYEDIRAANEVVLGTNFDWARDLLDTAAKAYGLGEEGRLRTAPHKHPAYIRPVPNQMIATITFDYGLPDTLTVVRIPQGNPVTLRWWPK